MPILLQNKEFIDEWGNSTSFYRSNAGDKITLRLDLVSSIYISSSASPFILDAQTNTVVSGGVSWESEGFRVGDSVEGRVTQYGGAIVYSWSAHVTYVSGNTIKFDTIPHWADTSLQQIVFFVVVGRNRQSIECFLNHVENAVPSNDFSLIDGEATRFRFSQIDSMAIGSDQNAVIVGNQSGQYLISAKITRLANPAVSDTRYHLEVVFINSGIYDQSWFDSSECLKAILKMMWSSIEGEPYQQTPLIFSNSANTGWFNEPHNSDVINGSLLSGVSEIDYSIPTSFSVVIDGEITELGIGASYISKNDSYFKNKPLQQGVYGMIIPTSDLSITTYSSLTNESGAGYDIQITAINTVGSQTTIDCTFTPNAQFSSFMDSVEEGDRLFYIWFKCGNLNLLAFQNQLTTTPPQGGELIMEVSKPFYDHLENTNDGSGVTTYNRFDTEDDLAYFGKFLMDKNGIYQSFKVRIEAYNTVTEEDFTLKETVFSFATTQINSSGVYLIDETITVNSQLPTTSNKRDASLKLDPTIDTIDKFGVSIYYPVVLDWRYWMQQLNASSDFYPNQIKNWQQYAQSGSWTVRMELELLKDGLAFTHADQISILNYNAKAQIASSIQYIKESDSSVVSGLIYGEIMRIKSTHIFSGGSWTSSTWGMITIERKENSPRWISSTVLDFDNNQSNPLYPITGETKAKLTIIGDTATIECLCDTTKLSGNTESVTAKIKDPEMTTPPIGKIMADGTPKITADGNRKVLA